MLLAAANLSAQLSDIAFTEAEAQWLHDHPVIRVSNEMDWPPFDFAVGSMPQGYSIDLLNLVAERIGIEFEYVNGYSWPELVELFKRGELDLLHPASKNAEREEFALFSNPVTQNKTYFIIRIDGSEIAEVKQLASKKVAVLEGFASTQFIEASYPHLDLYYVTDAEEALFAVSAGVADVAITNDHVARFIANQKRINDVKVSGWFREYDQGLNSDLHYMVQKDAPELLSMLNKALSTILPSDLEPLEAKWFGKAPSGQTTQEPVPDSLTLDLTTEELEWLQTNPVVRAHNEESWRPFNFNADGTPQGYSISYLNLVAEKVGLTVEYVTGKAWGDYIQMLKDGDLDVMLNMAYSEERAAFALFTEPYLTIAPVLFSRTGEDPVSSMEDIFGKRFAIPRGFFMEGIIGQYPDVEIVPVADTRAAIMLVSDSRADFLFDMIPTVSYYAKAMLIDNIQPAGILGIDAENPVGLRMGIRKNQPILHSILSKALDKVSEAEIASLDREWLGSSGDGSVRLSAEEQAWLSDHPVIRVHNELNWPPFNYNKNGEPQGLSIDYMNLLASRIGIEVIYVSGEWGELLDQALNKELDVMLNIVKTPERLKHLVYTDTYALNPNVIIAREESSVSDAQSLVGKKAAYPDGWFYDEVLKTAFPEIMRVPMKDTLATLKAVQFGEVDAALGELAVTTFLIRENLLTGLAIKGAFETGNPEIERLNIAVRNDWPTLAAILDKALLSITPEEHRQLQSKWLGDLQSTDAVDPNLGLTEAEKQWLKAHPTIRLGDDFAWPPFVFTNAKDEFLGIASGYIESVSKKLQIEILPEMGLTWGQVLEGIKSHELDIMPVVVRTAEREAFMAFTKPYISLPIAVATRRDSPYMDNLSDLAGNRVGVVEGYAIQKLLTEDYPALNVIPQTSVAVGLVALEKGELGAFVANLGVINYEIDRRNLDSLKIAAPTPYTDELSIGVRKDWPELVAILDKALDSIGEQEQTAIKNTWMGITVEFGTQLSTILKWGIPALFVVLAIVAFVMIWNRRLSVEVTERKKKETLIALGARISQLLTKADTLKAMLQSITDVLVTDLGVAFTRIWIVNESENNLALQASSGLYTHIDGDHQTLPIGGDSKIGRVVFEQRPNTSNDIQDNPYVKDKEWAKEKGLTAFAGIPMIVDGQAVGAMVAFSREPIDGDTVNSLLSVGDSIAVAIKRNRAEEETIRLLEETQAARKIAVEATKAKSDFLANMSHEIRTPMNAIMGMTHLALQTDLTIKQQDYLKKTHTAATSLLGLINDILDFSKIEAGKMDMESVDFLLDDVMDNVSTLISIKAEDKGLGLAFKTTPSVPRYLVGDPLRLGQILINLANNAVKFTEKGEITVETVLIEETEESFTLQFAVRDTGIGLTKEQIGKLFKSFSQADSSTTRKFGGTGLGLTISKRLVEMMNGRIWIESEAGKGSSFIFTASFGHGNEAEIAAGSLQKGFDQESLKSIQDSPAKRPRKKEEGFRVEGGHRLSIGSGATLASLYLPNTSTCLIAYWGHLIPI